MQGGFLAGSDFSGSNMSHCNLQAGAISKGNFSNVNFQGAKLSATSFTSANLTGANLSATQMVLMDISDAIPKDVNLNNGSIINSTFDYGDLAKTNFSQPVIQGASFQYANLKDVNFDGVTLTNYTFFGATTSESTFAGAKFLNTILPDGSIKTNAKVQPSPATFGPPHAFITIEEIDPMFAAANQAQTSGLYSYGDIVNGVPLKARAQARYADLNS